MKLYNPPVNEDKKAQPPLWYGGPDYFRVKKWANGVENRVPRGKRKTNPRNIIIRKLIQTGGRKS